MKNKILPNAEHAHELLLVSCADNDREEELSWLLKKYTFPQSCLDKALKRAIYYVNSHNIKNLYQYGGDIFKEHKVITIASSYNHQKLLSWALSNYDINQCKDALKFLKLPSKEDEFLEELLKMKVQELILKEETKMTIYTTAFNKKIKL